MTLHINVFFYKQGNVREVVDVTAVTLNWQETLLGLADAVQWEFRKKNPYITNIYSKSNNAGSYTMETLQLKFSMKSINPKIQSLCNMITTSRWGKDWCDRESAVRKYIFWSFVDAGHNLLSASDVFGTLKFANGMKTPKWMLLKLIHSYQS